MNAGALLIPVTTLLFRMHRNYTGQRGGALRRNISRGALVKNNENTSGTACPWSPFLFLTYGFNEVITISAAHNKAIWSARIKPEHADAEFAPAQTGAHLRRMRRNFGPNSRRFCPSFGPC